MSEIRKVNDESEGQGKNLDAFDIAANAMDGDDILGGSGDDRPHQEDEPR